MLHQGFSKKERMHYHLRHEKILNDNVSDLNKKNTGNIFLFDEEFLSEYDVSKLILNYKKYEKKKNFMSRLKRFISFILYFFPRFKSIYRNFFNNKAIKETLFHSTFFQ